MKSRGVWSSEPWCLVVGRKGRTGEAAQATGWGRTWQHLLSSPHPHAAELWNRLLQGAGTDKGERGSCALAGGGESIQESRGRDPLLDAAELRRDLSWTQLLHQHPSGHAVQVVPVFLGQTKEGGDTSVDYLPCPEEMKACASLLFIWESSPLCFELAGWCQVWYVSQRSWFAIGSCGGRCC